MTLKRTSSELPVIVIGAGPIGLAAAAHLIEEGIDFTIIEAGATPAAAIESWRHVRLFTPWRYLVDESARRLLEASGWSAPDGEYVPTGGELIRDYLTPLAALPEIAPHLQLGTRATTITRLGVDKLKSAGRENLPFAVIVTGPNGEFTIEGSSVIDASGTHGSPNPLGSSGVKALGEKELSNRLYYGIPDVNGRDRERFAGKRVGVVGSGHSAFNTLLDLQTLNAETGTDVTWFVRGQGMDTLWGGEDDDALAGRGALGKRARGLAESGALSIESGFATAAIVEGHDGLVLESYDGARSHPLDEVIVVTGFRPDLELTRELRLDLDPLVEAPSTLAPLIDPNLHSCGTVPPHGYKELSHPEKGFYMIGMKSYGRAPTFLLMTGYEQARSVVKALAGDFEAAARVELDLPQTGVCTVDLGIGAHVRSCCGGEAPTRIDGAALEHDLVVAEPDVAAAQPEVPQPEAEAGGCCDPGVPVTVGASDEPDSSCYCN